MLTATFADVFGPIFSEVFHAPDAKDVALKNYKGFDVVVKEPGQYMLFDCKYNSYSKKAYPDLQDAKKAADELFVKRIQTAGYTALAKVLAPA